MGSIDYLKKCPKCNGIIEFEYCYKNGELYTLFDTCKCKIKCEYKKLIEPTIQESKKYENDKYEEFFGKKSQKANIP